MNHATNIPHSWIGDFSQAGGNLSLPEENDMVNAARRLKGNKAPGPDGSLPSTLRRIFFNQFEVTEGGEKLMSFISECIKLGVMPPSWRASTLCVFPKKNDGLRPIQITTSPYRYIVNVLFRHIQSTYDVTGLVGPHQHGLAREGCPLIAQTMQLLLSHGDADGWPVSLHH